MKAKKLKIAVYAISKNEELFVKRFCDSAKDADIILIADTGSTDRTVELAHECGAMVVSIYINPWRFDKARDASLFSVPADVDICVSLDLDEVLVPGWREEIERVWQDDTTKLSYKSDWGGGLVFSNNRIHCREGYYWMCPIHEYVTSDNRIAEVWAYTDMILVTHHPDNNKSRGQYLPLLEMSVKEDPNSTRNMLYYGRELTYYNKWDEAIDTLKKCLVMTDALCLADCAYVMRLLGKSYSSLERSDESIYWYRRSIAEYPDTRESWIELAWECYNHSQWEECFAYAGRALSIKESVFMYSMDASAWGARPHDIYALAAHTLGLKDIAIKHGTIAIELSPDDERLKSNLVYYLE
jgi:tetratricopeptide (TPR) repeat protein